MHNYIILVVINNYSYSYKFSELVFWCNNCTSNGIKSSTLKVQS